MAETTQQNVYDYLSVKRNITQFIKQSDYIFLRDLHNKLSPAVALLEEKHRKEIESQKVHDAKRQEILALIGSKGFSLRDLIEGNKKPQVRRPMKYQYSDNGQMKEWSGVGRTPRAIQDEIDSGKVLEDFEIQIEQ